MNLLDTLEIYYLDGKLIKQSHPDFPLTVWNYSRTCQYNGWWDEVTTMCRGVVTDDITGEIVARPFRKFFNLEENRHSPTEHFDVYEKMDGSLIIVFFYNGEWLVGSRGSFTSEQANDARKLFGNYNSQVLDPEYTYMFELIVPWNRIVVNYGDREELVLLGGIRTIDGKELEYGGLKSIAEEFGSPVVDKYDGVLDYSILKGIINDNSEGFVIRFSNGDRIKIKGEEYVRLHRIVTNISSIDIWETLRDKDRDIEDLLKDVPNEFDDWVRKTIQELNYKYMTVQEHAGKLMDNLYESNNGDLPFKTRGEFAEWVHTQERHIRPILFRMYEGRDYDDIIWNLIKPKYQKAFKKEG